MPPGTGGWPPESRNCKVVCPVYIYTIHAIWEMASYDGYQLGIFNTYMCHSSDSIERICMFTCIHLQILHLMKILAWSDLYTKNVYTGIPINKINQILYVLSPLNRLLIQRMYIDWYLHKHILTHLSISEGGEIQ